MKKIIIALLLPIGIFSCGEAGVGFDAGTRFTLPSCATEPSFSGCIPDIDILIPGVPIDVVDPVVVDPDETSFQYDLADIEGFESALQELNSENGLIFFNELTFSLDGIEPDEEFGIDNISLVFRLSGQDVTVFVVNPVENFTLQNLEDRDVFLVDETGRDITSLIEQELLLRQQLDMRVIFDLGDVSSSPSDRNIDFTFEPTFDVDIRVEDILD